ncbi:MAG: tRNA guanosine(34) transglycosylase Tgt [Dehalococcoidia bacterium]|nr:MAG: tRNA guanosine(34) transglycosylase Tgt [Dehalococcoidia bacterium]
MNFNVTKTCASFGARAGELVTPRGAVQTPIFLPVASQASVKTLTPREIGEIGFHMLLANAYHLYLRPGISVIEEMGGLHRFMGWNGAILTDSGGYQIFSLASLRQVTDEGVSFSSHVDGSQHFITPEMAIENQQSLGADIIMVLDECLPSDADFNQTRRAMNRTHLWAVKCRQLHNRDDQSLFAIVQGGIFPELRRKSAKYLVSLDFPGYAIGGLSLGEPKDVTWKITGDTVALLPPSKPRYLMGVGSPEDLVQAVSRGVDIFDSALPTRIARNGALFTLNGRINIEKSIYKKMAEPVDPDCDCYACRDFSAAYLHHLFHSGELLALRLATIHNLTFIYNLMSSIRKAILNDTFSSFKDTFLRNYKPTNEKARISQKQKWLEMCSENK